MGSLSSGWRVIGASVRGASHVRADQPNQDALRWLPASGQGLPLMVAVSDGHGSAKSFRSERGSMLATLTATAALEDFLSVAVVLPSLSAVKRYAEDTLPQQITRRWHEAIEVDLAEDPFNEIELERLAAKEGATSRQRVETQPAVAYGATIVTALVTPEYLLFVQLGDGDILTVTDEGEVSRPLPVDKRLFANETTSLSSKNAWRDFRVGFQTLNGPPPALILLATDGYANSFRDDQGFLKVGSDMLDIIRADGLDVVRDNLPTWLSEASAAGSGDDITVAIIYKD